MRDLRGNQLLFRAPERRRIRQSNQDDVGRALFAAQIGHVKGRVSNLNNLMFGRKIDADEQIDVRKFWNLGHNEKDFARFPPALSSRNYLQWKAWQCGQSQGAGRRLLRKHREQIPNFRRLC